MSRNEITSGFPILEGLRADGPYAPWRTPLMVFGQFVGVWDLDVTFYDEVGQRSYEGQWEWSFAWILDGRAIQDVLRYRLHPEQPEQPGQGTASRWAAGGTSIRHCDAVTGRWRVFYLGAVGGITVLLEGGMAGDNIVIEGPDYPDGVQNRWTFSNISDTGFEWTGLESADGQTWRLNQKMLATRRTGT